MESVVVIKTGDSDKCKVIDLIECPVCFESFSVLDGVYQYSATIGAKVLVCPKHSELTVNDEINVQVSLKKAMDNKRGHVLKDGVMVKRHYLLDKLSDKQMKNILGDPYA